MEHPPGVSFAVAHIGNHRGTPREERSSESRSRSLGRPLATLGGYAGRAGLRPRPSVSQAATSPAAIRPATASLPSARMTDNPMTAEELESLRAELEQLEGPARAEMAEQIKTARGWGDLK